MDIVTALLAVAVTVTYAYVPLSAECRMAPVLDAR